MSLTPGVARGQVGSNSINQALLDAVVLDSFTVAALTAAGFAAAHKGKIVECSNGNAGAKCLAYSDGTNFKVIALGATVAAS
jgi:hypothetical protein